MSEPRKYVSRSAVMAVCETLGYDPMDVYSIALTGSEVSLCLFEKGEDGKRYFSEPTGLLGFAKRFENLTIVENDELADHANTLAEGDAK